MHIGIISGEYPPMQGGVGAYTHILAHELTRQGQSVALLSTQDAHENTLPIHTVRRWNPGSLRDVRQWVQAEKPDIINIQYQTAAYGMSPFIHFIPDIIRAVPVVTTFHDLRFPYLFPKAGPLRPWIVRHLAHSSAGVIVTNPEDAQQIASIPHQMIPIGSNIRAELPASYDREAWRSKAGVKPDDYLLAHFGLINRSKGLHILLHSLADLHHHGIPARLLIIGGTAGSSDPTNVTYTQEIEDQIKREHLTDFIHRTGYIEDEAVVSGYLSAADVVVLPFLDGASYRRGSLMAAVQYGCAIVTTTPQIPTAAFVDGVNMRFVPANDPHALADTLKQLRDEPDQRQTLGSGTFQLRQLFDWSQIAADTIAYFQHILRQQH